jgi:hypothetical protein
MPGGIANSESCRYVRHSTCTLPSTSQCWAWGLSLIGLLGAIKGEQPGLGVFAAEANVPNDLRRDHAERDAISAVTHGEEAVRLFADRADERQAIVALAEKPAAAGRRRFRLETRLRGRFQSQF